MASRLRVPSRLTVTVFLVTATSGCSSPPVVDGGRDVPGADTVDAVVVDASGADGGLDAASDGAPVDAVADAPADGARDGTVMDAGSDAVPGADAEPDGATVDSADDVEACMPQSFRAGYFECLNDPAADATGGCSGLYCTDQECAAGCVACPTRDAQPTGYVCLRTSSSDGGSSACPSQRVCDPADCPTGCSACNEPVFCSPDSASDAAPQRCDPEFACGFTSCPPGCRPLG